MMFLKLCTAVLLTGLCFAGVAGAADGKDSGSLVSVDLLAKAGIETVWQQALPLNSKERLGTINALGDGVFILTSTNYLFGINAADGGMMFADRIAAQGLQLLPLDRSGEGLIVVTGSSVRKLDVKTGSERSRIKVPFGVVAKPATNEKFYYLAADDGKVYAYDTSDQVLVFKAAGDRGSLMTNVAATNNYVVFTTDKGAIVAMRPNRPVQMWRYNASGAISGRIVLDDGSVYVSSMDTNVYKFDVRTGKIVWNYMAGAQLVEGPKVTASAVYQFAGDNGVYALDKNGNAKVLWQEKDGRDLLAERSGKAYLISKKQSIIVVDNATGKRTGEVSIPGVDMWAASLADGMIYVGNAATGKVACLRPIDR
jgi:eukaryotic-like serine/threonine-protein kinase